MPRSYAKICLLLQFILFTHLSFAQSRELTVSLGESLSAIEINVGTVGAAIRMHNDDIAIITNLRAKVNGTSPSQLLLSLDKQKRVMIIGYFFSSVAKQEEAILKLSPFPIPFKDGYGAGYDNQIIVNASPQSGSFLLSIIDRKLFAQFSSLEEKGLIESIDKSYFSGTRPKENTDLLIMPGQSKKEVVKVLQNYGAQYNNEPGGNIRINSVGKTVLGAWVSEGYVIMTADGRAMQVFYQFRSDSEGVNFAGKLSAVRANAAQAKLLRTKSQFAAVRQDNLFILASPQDGQYRVVLMDVRAVKETSPRSYQEILKTLESAKDLEKFAK